MTHITTHRLQQRSHSVPEFGKQRPPHFSSQTLLTSWARGRLVTNTENASIESAQCPPARRRDGYEALGQVRCACSQLCGQEQELSRGLDECSEFIDGFLRVDHTAIG